MLLIAGGGAPSHLHCWLEGGPFILPLLAIGGWSPFIFPLLAGGGGGALLYSYVFAYLNFAHIL